MTLNPSIILVGKTYMTVKQPSSWVVRDERNHKMGIRIQHGNIPAGRVVNVERGVGVELALALRQDPKVVAVQMDGVVDCAGVVDHKVRPLVGLR